MACIVFEMKAKINHCRPLKVTAPLSDTAKPYTLDYTLERVYTLKNSTPCNTADTR